MIGLVLVVGIAIVVMALGLGIGILVSGRITRWLDREGAGGIARFPKLAAHRARMQARPAVKLALEQEGLTPA